MGVLLVVVAIIAVIAIVTLVTYVTVVGAVLHFISVAIVTWVHIIVVPVAASILYTNEDQASE